MSYSSYSIDQAYKYMEKSNRKLSFENKNKSLAIKKVIKSSFQIYCLNLRFF